MLFNQIKTAVLLATLSGLLMLMGSFFGTRGLLTFAIISLAINGFAYFFSARMILGMYRAKPLDQNHYRWIYDIVQGLVERENIPMPQLWLVPNQIANAFATGRSTKHAHIALTEGILDTLDESELRGVLAHEVSHIQNGDIVINTVAATLATTIGFMANAMRQMPMQHDQQGNNERRVNPLARLLMVVLMPMAASLIRLSISRTREYLADESGAYLSHDPLALASALQKLHAKSKQVAFGRYDMQYAATAHMFIVNPFTIGGLARLFATHPPMEKRVERLRKIYEEMMNRG